MEDTRYHELLQSIRQGDQVKYEREVDVTCRASNVAEGETEKFAISKLRYKKAPNDTIVHVLAHHGRLEMLKYLTEKIPKTDFLDVKNAEGKTPLHEAAQFSKPEVVEFLVQHGCDVNALKRADWTPLMLAATRVGEEAQRTVKVLLDVGAKATLTNKDGWTAFHISAREGDLCIIKLFLQSDPKAWKTISNNGRTPLHTSALAGHLVVVRYLIEVCGHEIDCRDSCQSTPLMDACKAGQLEVVKCLLEKGSDMFAKDAMERTSLDVAAHCGQVEVVEFLLEHVVAAGQGDRIPKVGPLHWAAKEGHVSVVNSLLRTGIFSPHTLDNSGRCPLELAIGGQHVLTAKALLHHAEYFFNLKLLELAKTAEMQDLLHKTFINTNIKIFFPSEEIHSNSVSR